MLLRLAFVAAFLWPLISAHSSPAEIEALNGLCNKTFASANASGAYTFSPDVIQAGSGSGGLAQDVSWARTIYINDTSTQSTIWFSTGGANYSDDFNLGYDACAITLANITSSAQYNGRNDNGTCLSLFDADCISALNSLVESRANELVDTPSSYDSNSNLTNGALPGVCDSIAQTIQSNFPSQCQKYWNSSLATSQPLTDYNDTSINGECCSDFQQIISGCTIQDYNKTYYPLGESFLAGQYVSAYDEWSYQITPVLTVFMPIANYMRTVTVTTVSQLICVRTNSFSAGSRIPPPQPSPPAQSNNHLSGGDIAGIVVGVVAALAILGGLAFWFWRRRRKSNDLSKWASNGNQTTYDEKNFSPVVEVPDSAAPTFASAELSPESVVRPELPTTKSHQKNELEASETHRSELPDHAANDYLIK